ncbi:NACHT and WD40 domain protein [Sarocladium implicatum]|nr:NACHT and WD40 domain protein [Sarocladium implicatum]
MLRKKETFTVITPIPGFIPRQLAVDILHSHSEVITLNPLVLDHKPIPAPRDAAADEYYSTWYEITERVQVVPGMGKMGSSKISFQGCFHDMPWGLQTHIYAPLQIDMRNKYRISGNQPGLEPPEDREIGLEALGAPKDGLYLREDIEIKCNITLTSFVKSTAKAASREMVQRIIKKAELLDAGILQAMMQDGRLKTLNPNDRSSTIPDGMPPMCSPNLTSTSPGMPPPGYDNPSNPASPRNASFAGVSSSPSLRYARPQSTQGWSTPGPYHQMAYQNQQNQYMQQQQQQQFMQQQYPQQPMQQQQQQQQPYGEKQQNVAFEMAGDFEHAPADKRTGDAQTFAAELPAPGPNQVAQTELASNHPAVAQR